MRQMTVILAVFALYTASVYPQGVYDAYQHGTTIRGKLTITDLDNPKCKLKKPNEQLMLYLEEKTDFLIPRGIRTDLNEVGEFSFPVDSRYIDYRLVILLKPSSFPTWQTILHAYNAPNTYDLTLSCVRDMTLSNPQ